MTSGLSAYDIESGRPTGMAGTVLMSKPSAGSLLACPSGALSDRQFVIESGWSRKFELADLDCISLSAAYRYKNFGGAIGLWQMGTPDYYVEKKLRVVFSYLYRSFGFGLITSGRMIDLGDGLGRLRAAAIGLGATYRYENYYFGLTVDNLNRPTIAENLEGENIITSILAEIHGGKRHSVTGRLVLEKYEKPQLSIGQNIYVMDRNSLFWGLGHNPLTFGGGLEIEHRRFSIIYAVSYHPVLGFSHNISIQFLMAAILSEG